MGIKNVKLDTEFESVGKNAKDSLKRIIKLKSFENSNKSQKLNFCATFLLGTFFA
jgi:hypothetical protein